MRPLRSKNLKIRNYLENLSIDWRIILKWIFEIGDKRVWTGFIWFMTGTSAVL
jgi:hypothetical protein